MGAERDYAGIENVHQTTRFDGCRGGCQGRVASCAGYYFTSLAPRLKNIRPVVSSEKHTSAVKSSRSTTVRPFLAEGETSDATIHTGSAHVDGTTRGAAGTRV